MSDSTPDWSTMGAYTSPFSGNGMEFLPLGVPPDHSGLVLHESGYMANRPCWNYPKVLSPFWRLYYDLEPGHKVVFAHREVILGPDRLVLIPDHSLFHAVGSDPRPKFWLAFNSTRRPAPHQAVPIELEPSSIELARISGLSESAFNRLFRRYEGVSPTQFITQVRVREVARLLIHSELSLDDIAEKCGFPNRAYLARIFGSTIGATPAQFRREVRVAAAVR